MAAHDPSDYEGLNKLNEQLTAVNTESDDLEAEWLETVTFTRPRQFAGASRYANSHGLINSTSVPSKSLILRVAMAASQEQAIAAIMAS